MPRLAVKTSVLYSLLLWGSTHSQAADTGFNENTSLTPKLVISKTFKGLSAFAHNPFHAPVVVFTKQALLANGQDHVELPAQSTQHIALNPTLNQDIQYQWRFGTLTPTVNAPIALNLPFKRGTGVIAQGPGGKFSHTSPAQFHAVDIGLKKGTVIRAAQAGTVFTVIDHYTRSGLDPALQTQANTIQILHNDGSFASYSHIDTNTAKVAVGQQVQIGQALAKVGKIGYAAGIHLHLVVQINTVTGYQSIPFTLQHNDAVIPLEPQHLIKTSTSNWTFW